VGRHVVTGAQISAWDIVKSLLGPVLESLLIGLFVRARYADHATAWQPELVNAANLAMVIASATGIAGKWSTIKSMFGLWVYATAIVIILAGVLGLLPGGKSAEIRATIGLVSAFRFGLLGLIIIGTQINGNPTYLGPAITFALIDFILPLALAVEIGHRAGASAPAS
jgi:hypothetical protein